jgi:hypothetical protein
MRLENHSVSDPGLNATAKHVLVEAVQNEGRERILQNAVRGSVSTQDSWSHLLQEARLFSSTIKEAAIRQLLQARKQTERQGGSLRHLH